MPPKASKAAVEKVPLSLICGDEDSSVKKRARELFDQWSLELPGDHETVQAYVTNAGEALKAINQLREALQTLPFFGGGKVIWFKDCNFLAEDRTSASQLVTENLNELAKELEKFPWDKTRLIISAGKVDKRRSFYKTIDKLGSVETFVGWSTDDRDWGSKAEAFAEEWLTRNQKEIAHNALGTLVNSVGPNKRMLESELEKLVLFVGNRPKISLADVETITVKNKLAQAFALGDALGDRKLPRLLTLLDQEIWGMNVDSSKNEIGLLYGMIAKIRAMLFAKALLKEKYVSADGDYGRFKAQVEKIPSERLPQDKKINPQALNAYVLFRATGQSVNYSEAELVKAMELLLECNQKLVGSSLDSTLVLQQTLVHIVQGGSERR